MTPVLRCKLRVHVVEKVNKYDGTRTAECVKMHAVYGDEGSANASWSAATPAADFFLFITNPDAFDTLAQGTEYYVDLIPA